MKNEFINEVLVGIILLVLALGILNPFGIWMPGEVEMTVLFLTVVVFAIFAVFVWREKAQDEREEHLRMVASRLSWLTGSGVLLLALVVQGFAHSIDSWIVYALIAMIATKVIARVYVRRKY